MAQLCGRPAGHVMSSMDLASRLKPWQPHEEAVLKTMWADWVPARTIAAQLRRPVEDILQKAASLQLPERVEP
jgi:hypothetical protein